MGMKLRLDTTIVFLLFLYALAQFVPAYCAHYLFFVQACYSVVLQFDDPPETNHSPTQTTNFYSVNASGTAGPALASPSEEYTQTTTTT
jgi:hypothetical protein